MKDPSEEIEIENSFDKIKIEENNYENEDSLSFKPFKLISQSSL